MRLKFYLFITCLLCATTVNAQIVKRNASIRSLKDIVFQYIDAGKLKDSTAVYTFSLKISIEKTAGRKEIKAIINNPEIAAVFSGYDQFNKLDYDSLINEKGSRRLMLRYNLLVLSSGYDPKVVDIYNIPFAIRYLNEADDYNYLSLGNFIIQYDKKVYH